MRKLLMISLILILASCKSKKLTADSPQRFVIENLAQISSVEDLQNIYPNSMMESGTDMFEEGTKERAYTILYPNSENEVTITWNDSSPKEIYNIRVEKNGDWRSKSGITIGTPYETLVKLNGPIKFYGFGWDYSGAVDWNGGKLANSNIRVFLAPKNNPPNKFYGDAVIDATEEEIAALDLSVQTILFQKME